MSKHSIRSGRLSRLSASRSSSSASTRRSALLLGRGRVRLERERARSGRRAPGSRRFSPRSAARTSTRGAAPLGEELLERREVARVARHDDLRRHARRRAVVLERRTPRASSSGPGRRRSRGGSCSGRRACRRGAGRPARPHGRPRPRARSRRPCRPSAGRRPAARRGAGPRQQPVAVARGVLEALLGGRLAHLPLELALDRLRLAREELDHAVDDRAGTPPSRRSRRTGARQRSMW